MGSPLSIVPQIEAVAIRQEGQRVLILKGGTAILDLPPDAAIAVANAIIAKARLALQEQPKAAEQLAFDSAVLLRAGAPIGLSSHPKILSMAKTEAESNRDLRRYMPGGIKGTTQFGTPGVSSSKPKR